MCVCVYGQGRGREKGAADGGGGDDVSRLFFRREERERRRLVEERGLRARAARSGGDGRLYEMSEIARRADFLKVKFFE